MVIDNKLVSSDFGIDFKFQDKFKVELMLVGDVDKGCKVVKKCSDDC